MSEPLVIVQARLESERCPEKILTPIAGQPMLLWQLDRLRHIKADHRLIIALPATDLNRNVLAPLLMRHGYNVAVPARSLDDPRILLKPDDVLGRFAAVAERYAGSLGTPIVRITGDCPLIDPEVVDQALTLHASKIAAYTALGNTWADGLDVEVMTCDILLTAAREAKTRSDREHVTPFIWRNMGRFPQALLPCPLDLSKHCWSVDTPDDAETMSRLWVRLLQEVGSDFTWRDVYAVLCASSYWHWSVSRKRNQAYVDQVSRENEAPCDSWETMRYDNMAIDWSRGTGEELQTHGKTS